MIMRAIFTIVRTTSHVCGNLIGKLQGPHYISSAFPPRIPFIPLHSVVSTGDMADTKVWFSQ